MLKPGDTVGPYVIERLLAGGAARVYLARDAKLARPVALKVLHEIADPDAIAHFEVEVQALRSLRHAAVPTVYWAGHTPDRTPCYAMEHVAGLTLRQLLDGVRERHYERPSHAELLWMWRQLADAIGAVHGARLLHLAVRPEHVLVGTRMRVKLCGFGQVLPHGARAPDRRLRPEYMAPEFIEASPMDARADVFALGLTLHESISHVILGGRTGIPPWALIKRHQDGWRPPLPRSYDRTLPAGMEDAILGCLETDLLRRVKGMPELRRHLDAPALEKILAPEQAPAIDERRDPARRALARAAVAERAPAADPPRRTPAPTGPALARVIEQRGILPVDEALRIFVALLDNLESYHRRAQLHRDVEPETVFLERGEVRLRPPRPPAERVDLQARGPAAYAYVSPEELAGDELDERTDLYQAGLLLYEMLTAKRATTGTTLDMMWEVILKKTPTHVKFFNPDCPLAVGTLVQNLLEKKKVDRYRNIEEVRRALAGIASRRELPRTKGAVAAPAEPPTASPTVIRRAPDAPASPAALTFVTRGSAPGAPADQISLDPLRGRFRFGRLLGTGGMACVYEAVELASGRTVAVKFLKRADDPEITARFLQEGQLLAALASPSLVQVHAMGVADGFPYLVSEVLAGGSLRARLDRERKLSETAALAVMKDVLAGLAVCHERGVVHRDVKPENVLFAGPRPGTGIAKLADLGIARSYADGATALTLTGAIMGSPRYMAPEQIRGEAPCTATDVYACGVMLYELLAGVPPFRATQLVQLLTQHEQELPQPLVQHARGVTTRTLRAVERALAKRPGDRPAAAADLAALLCRQ